MVVHSTAVAIEMKEEDRMGEAEVIIDENIYFNRDRKQVTGKSEPRR